MVLEVDLAVRDGLLVGAVLVTGLVVVILVQVLSRRSDLVRIAGLGPNELSVVVAGLMFALVGLLVTRLSGEVFASLCGGAFGYVFGQARSDRSSGDADRAATDATQQTASNATSDA